MSAQFVDARQARFIRALDAAVGGAFQRYGVREGVPPSHAAVRAAIVDAAQAAVREFGPRTEGEARDEAPPVRELPTEPGAVVLADFVRGVEFDRPILLVRSTQANSAAGPLWYSPAEAIDGEWFHVDRHVTEWYAARVVAADDPDFDDAIAALRRVLAAVQRDDLGCVKKLQAVEFAAREALKRLDGEAP